MPCYDSRDTNRSQVPAAALCGILHAIPEPERAAVLARVDWKEAGVTLEQFQQWWATHQESDERMRRYCGSRHL